eukprot:PhF_6_TR929/c1_g2_i3/m.1608/K05648/ABCA5; ATP-binding cassette, subfamily A (ABC1), member 5
MTKLLFVMGVQPYQYVLSHFVSSLIRSLPGLLLFPIGIVVLGLFENTTSVAVLFSITLAFSVSTIFFAFVTAAMTDRPLWSNIVSFIFIYVVSGVAPVISTIGSIWVQLLFMLFLSPISYHVSAMHVLSDYTYTEEIVPFWVSCLMLVLNSVLYLLVAALIKRSNEGRLGNWPYYRSTELSLQQQQQVTSTKSEIGISADVVDCCVLFENVTKQYHVYDVPAVDQLHLKVRRGEIFALIGPNGAGKTTTLNLITGQMRPTKYDIALVDGFDIVREAKWISHGVGLCPQNDILFDHLNVYQHLRLFVDLRSDNQRVSEQRIQSVIKALDLNPSLRAGLMHKGMRRKLCIAIALVGNNPLVILDEPSSGLDPLSRRRLWQVMKQEKSEYGKTFIVSTHFMEEADSVGDSIGIMMNGKMRHCGTSTELKNVFGCGFYLKMVKSPKLAKYKGVELQELITSHVPTAVLHHETVGDVTYLLPASQTNLFEPLLEQLDQRHHMYGVLSYGLAMNSLEDVFIHLATEEHREEDEKSEEETSTTPMPKDGEERTAFVNDLEDRFETAPAVHTLSRYLHQVQTILFKRLLIFGNNTREKVFLFLFPVLIVSVALALMAGYGPGGNNSQPVERENDHSQEYRIAVVDTVQSLTTRTIINNLPKSYSLVAGPSASLSIVTLNVKQFLSGHYANSLDVLTSQGISGYYFHDNSAVTYLVNPNASRASGLRLVALLHVALRELISDGYVYSQNISYFSPNSSSHDATLPPDFNDMPMYDTFNLRICLVAAVVLGLSYSVAFVADEFHRGIYTLMRAHSMTPCAYITANLLYDLMWAIPPFIIFLIGIYFTPLEGLQGNASLVLFCGYVLFAMDVALGAYSLVALFPHLRPIFYVVILEGLTAVSSVVPYMIVSLGDLHQSHPYISVIIKSTTPASAWFHILDTLSKNHSPRYVSMDTFLSYDSHDEGVAIPLLGLLLMLVLISIILALTMSGVFRSRPIQLHEDDASPGPASDVDDEDVASEHQRVLHQGQMDMLQCVDLMKSFYTSRKKNNNTNGDDGEGGGRHVHAQRSRRYVRGLGWSGNKTALKAVRGVTFGVRRGECFGVLGPNGAGKTTLLRLLMRDLLPDSGTVTYASSEELDTLYRCGRLGVCLQHDALWPDLTARRHMEIYMRLRLTSLYRHDVDSAHIVQSLQNIHLGFTSKQNVDTYSTGMKRKLAVAIAMFTGSAVALLDEPSSGMDPHARRALWSVLRNAVRDQKVIVLTTHSLDEADAVCNRIGILGEGRMRCHGNAQHLKNRFGSGYTLTVLTQEDYRGDMRTMDDTIQRMFPGAQLEDCFGHQRKYALGDVRGLGRLFGLMEREKEGLHIQSYGLGQASSLEHIFMKIMGGQGTY